jgi:hypothetical protein
VSPTINPSRPTGHSAAGSGPDTKPGFRPPSRTIRPASAGDRAPRYRRAPRSAAVRRPSLRSTSRRAWSDGERSLPRCLDVCLARSSTLGPSEPKPTRPTVASSARPCLADARSLFVGSHSGQSRLKFSPGGPRRMRRAVSVRGGLVVDPQTFTYRRLVTPTRMRKPNRGRARRSGRAPPAHGTRSQALAASRCALFSTPARFLWDRS